MSNNLEKEISIVTLGCFLHDIGKVVQRAETVGDRPTKNHQRFGEDFITDVFKECSIEKIPYDWHCILKSIRHHHAKDGPSNAENTYIPWFAYEADNLASAHDRKNQTKLRDEKDDRLDETDDAVKDKWDKSRRLQSVFICLENANENNSYFDLWLREYLEDKETWSSKKYPYPCSEEKKDTKESYEKLKIELKRLIKNISKEEINLKLVNKCISYLEELFQFVPPDTFINHTNDVSLFDHLKLTAAIGSCLFYYLDENEPDLFKDVTNNFSYKDSQWNTIDKAKIRNQKAYLLFKADMSGIQDFIYNISTKNALKSLRGRSFYLELLLQQIADEILKFFSLSRCNQIYLGGGGFSLLLPNTKHVTDKLYLLENKFNEFLFNKFQGRLHISFGYSELSGNEIRAKTQNNKEEKGHPLNKAWEEVSHTISDKKLKKFSHMLNQVFKSLEKKNSAERLDECKVCHKEDKAENLKHPYETEDSDKDFNACSDCVNLIKFGEWLTKEEKYFKFENNENGLFPLVDLQSRDIKHLDLKLCNKEDSGCFVFNNDHPFIPPKIYWSTAFARTNNEKEISDFEELAKKSTGVERIGVLRADIDNLGKVFKGSEDKITGKKYGMNQDLKSISRDSSVSKNLAKFFTHYLNRIIEDNYKNSISVVYSGGDDLFLVGAWDKVIDCAFEINKKFKEYTLGALTLSAGISIHGPKYPLYRMAKDSGEAEKAAKKNPEKNSLCIYFDDGILRENNPSHTFSWDEWKKVKDLKDKLLKLIEMGLSTGYVYELLIYFKNIAQSTKPQNFRFPRILYNTVRMEEQNSELKDNEEWKNFKNTLFQDLESNNNCKYYETALNWVLLEAREKSEIRR